MNLGGPLSRDFAPAGTVGPGGQAGADMSLSGHQGAQERVLEHLARGRGVAPRRTGRLLSSKPAPCLSKKLWTGPSLYRIEIVLPERAVHWGFPVSPLGGSAWADKSHWFLTVRGITPANPSCGIYTRASAVSGVWSQKSHVPRLFLVAGKPPHH